MGGKQKDFFKAAKSRGDRILLASLATALLIVSVKMILDGIAAYGESTRLENIWSVAAVILYSGVCVVSLCALSWAFFKPAFIEKLFNKIAPYVTKVLVGIMVLVILFIFYLLLLKQA